MKAILRSLGSCVPEKVLTNQDLSAMVDTSDEWIRTHTGIGKRHVAADGEATSDLAVKAALAALEFTRNDGGIPVSAADIDLILCATATPDHVGFPSTACIIQDRIQAVRAGAMDITAACTGFIYGVETAKNFILAGSARNVLVIGAEVFTRILNWKDRSTCVLFGDAAGAAIVSAADLSDTSLHSSGSIGKSFLASSGSGALHLCRLAGGTRYPWKPGVTPEEDLYLSMNGRQVYVFAVQAIIDSVHAILDANGLGFNDIDLVVPHQANRRIIEAACKREGWDENLFFTNMDEYANTSAASIPLAMDELYRQGRLRRGMKVITVGFGAGLTYGGNLITF